jgi:hypothetical protein
MLLFGQPTVHSVIRSRRKHGDRHLIKTVQLAAVLSIIAACNRAADAAAPTVTIQTATSPDDLFPGGRVVYPEQNDSVLVAKFGPIEIGATGDFLIPDLSEGNVKHYARDGHLIRVIGRKGKGPGEFMTPFFARFLRGDSLLVADLAYGTWSGARGRPRFVASRAGILAGIRNIGDSLRIDFIDTRKE